MRKSFLLLVVFLLVGCGVPVESGEPITVILAASADLSREGIKYDHHIIERGEFSATSGESVLDFLTRVLEEKNVSFEVKDQAGIAYVQAIGGVEAGTYGSQSGWVYRINGEVPNVGMGEYRLSDGERIGVNFVQSMVGMFGEE